MFDIVKSELVEVGFVKVDAIVRDCIADHTAMRFFALPGHRQRLGTKAGIYPFSGRDVCWSIQLPPPTVDWL